MNDYKNEIKIWDEHSKKHILNATSILIKELKHKKDIVVVDVGANSGTYFDELDKSLNVSKAILFEVQPQLYSYLCEKYKDRTNITVENIAMSDKVQGFVLNDIAFKYEVENSVGTPGYNLGLSKINYNNNSEIKTNYFDNIRDRYNLERIDLLKIDTETEDLLVLKGFTETIKLLKQKPIIEFENNWWEKYTLEESQKILNDFCNECGYVNDIDLEKRGDHFLFPITENVDVNTIDRKNITIVTGLWDLKRGDLEGWAKRDFQHYKNKFFEFLETDISMCIWIPEELREEVLKIRGDKPTKIFIKNVEDFKSWNPFFDKIQSIRNNPSWRNFAGWLPESPQAALEFYNPMMFTKMFMLNDSTIVNPFKTDYFFWVDGGLTNTVNKGYFTKHKVLNNLDNYVLKHNSKFVQISYPYDANEEIHGFERKAMARYCQTDFVNYVCRGGFFGGNAESINQINNLYYGVMESTLKEGLMGADECLFTILAHRHTDLIHRYEIEGNGLVWPFFEELINYTETELKQDQTFLNPSNAAVYVIGFNSPNQFETLIKSMYSYDEDFITKPKKFLLDNSSDVSTFEKYSELCEKHGFEHIKKDNLGICGGRQWVAEHANDNGFDFYFFFEDDMFFYNGESTTCRNGFNRYVKNLYKNSIEIALKNNFDFVKLNFTEFFGDNGVQWSWYNVPQNIREKYFPNKTKLPVRGLDPDAPRTKFNSVKTHNGIPFIDGEVYYCNWPQVVTRHGNKKMFLDEKWSNPFEQTWMSHMFQLTTKGELNPGLLLLTPTEHNRFEHYEGALRKES
jgi:FkbM family methyltransferase